MKRWTIRVCPHCGRWTKPQEQKYRYVVCTCSRAMEEIEVVPASQLDKIHDKRCEGNSCKCVNRAIAAREAAASATTTISRIEREREELRSQLSTLVEAVGEHERATGLDPFERGDDIRGPHDHALYSVLHSLEEET